MFGFKKEKKEFKVLMMGGYQCGKTTIISALFNQVVNGFASDYISICDRTYRKDFGQLDLSDKLLELISKLKKGGKDCFVISSSPTYCINEYRFGITSEGRNYVDLVFVDVFGSAYDSYNKHNDEIKLFVRNSDIFIVAIDTPFLMQKSQVVAELANRVSSIKYYLSYVDEAPKQVIFVPVKCEKWIKENRIGEVIEKVEAVYGSTIKDLKTRSNIDISIIPVETAGDIIFDEMTSSKVLINYDTHIQTPCCVITDSLVRFYNGKLHRIKPQEAIMDNVGAYFPNTSIERPLSWFRLYHEPKAIYSPNNCDQIFFHMIRFMGKGLGSHFAQKLFDKLIKGGIVKNNIEGIKTI